MTPEDMMPVDLDVAAMWTLSEDRTTARLRLPPVPLEGLPQPLELHLDFDADAIDDILGRLSVLRVKVRALGGSPNN
jgi:hypothetical protein